MSTIWFGTEEHAQWIPCPKINMQAGKVSWGTVAKYLGGGNFARRSTTAAKEYGMEWGLKSRDELRPVLDFADSFYGGGDLYFTDPMAMDKNILPSYWASGYLNAIDGPLSASTWAYWPPSTTGIMTGVARPELTHLGESTNGFPMMSGGSFGNHRIFIPVPPGYSLWLSVHHTDAAPGGPVAVRKLVKGVQVGTISYPPIEALTAPRLLGYSDISSVAHTGIEISVTGEFYYTGMMAQIIPTGVSANSSTPFISGQGHSGLQIAEPGVDYYEYSSALDKVQATARLIEVGAWR